MTVGLYLFHIENMQIMTAESSAIIVTNIQPAGCDLPLFVLYYLWSRMHLYK